MLIFSSLSSPGLHALTLAQAAAPANGQQPNPLLLNLPIFIFFGVIFYYLLIRPQQKKAREQADLVAAMRSGDEVVVNGMHGIVANPRDPASKTVLVKFAENCKIEVDKSAVTSVAKADGGTVKAVPVTKS